MGTKGFITLATGSEKYYKAAANLLKSYLLFHSDKSKYYNPNSERLPFAILADAHNEYTAMFDDVIILENATKSYFDKISLLNNIPYDETIFVESDCLAYNDLNDYFESFIGADDFSVFGRCVPKDANNGWFLLEEAGKYKNDIEFIPRFHSAVLFMRKGGKCQKMYEICMDINNHYDDYCIGGSREAIDDKLLAVSSAAVGCKPTQLKMYYYNYYPLFFVNGYHPRPKMHKLINSFYAKPEKQFYERAMICHWGNSYTQKYLYKREVHSIERILSGKSPQPYVFFSGVVYPFYLVNAKIDLIIRPKIIMSLSRIECLRKLWHRIRK